MEISHRRLADVLIVAPAGRISHENAEDFRLALEPHLRRCVAGGDKVVIDLSGLEYISSAGLRVFMLAAKQVKAQDGIVVIAAMQQVVREIFEISRFNLLFETFGTAAQALEKLSPGAASAFRAP